jgi:hypothetical protein
MIAQFPCSNYLAVIDDGEGAESSPLLGYLSPNVIDDSSSDRTREALNNGGSSAG